MQVLCMGHAPPWGSGTLDRPRTIGLVGYNVHVGMGTNALHDKTFIHEYEYEYSLSKFIHTMNNQGSTLFIP